MSERSKDLASVGVDLMERMIDCLPGLAVRVLAGERAALLCEMVEGKATANVAEVERSPGWTELAPGNFVDLREVIAVETGPDYEVDLDGDDDSDCCEVRFQLRSGACSNVPCDSKAEAIRLASAIAELCGWTGESLCDGAPNSSEPKGGRRSRVGSAHEVDPEGDALGEPVQADTPDEGRV